MSVAVVVYVTHFPPALSPTYTITGHRRYKHQSVRSWHKIRSLGLTCPRCDKGSTSRAIRRFHGLALLRPGDNHPLRSIPQFLSLRARVRGPIALFVVRNRREESVRNRSCWRLPHKNRMSRKEKSQMSFYIFFYPFLFRIHNITNVRRDSPFFF